MADETLIELEPDRQPLVLQRVHRQEADAVRVVLDVHLIRRLELELERAKCTPVEAPVAKKATTQQDVAMAPYKEYRGHGEHPIWVGRGSAHNDELTFKVARPWHVWFHVRGSPGAHVVVPLRKDVSLPPEVLLDAPERARTVKWTGAGHDVTDGPYIEAKEWLVGFYLVDCATPEEAVARGRSICLDASRIAEGPWAVPAR